MYNILKSECNNEYDEDKYCMNCNQYGHEYKKCPEPVISSGIILYQFEDKYLPDIKNCNYEIKNSFDSLRDLYRDKYYLDKNIKYLMICRRHSIGFVDIIRGKYSFQNLSYFKNLVSLLTKDEMNILLNNSFDELWKNLWVQKDPIITTDFSNSKLKFKIIKNGVRFENSNDIIKLENLIISTKKKYDEPEWGFPKGRRNIGESDYDCALREFYEETKIDIDKIGLIDVDPFIEIYKAYNGVRYKHVYYLAQYKNYNGRRRIKFNNDEIITLDNGDNKEQFIEVSKISWFNINDCNTHIRKYYYEKKNVLNRVHAYLCRLLKNN